jgi:hypothetical protein
MTSDTIHYPKLIDHSMRMLVRDVLRMAQHNGLHNGHHFYISFSVIHPNVRMSEVLCAKYPHEMTIVIQHQYWDFKVEDAQFHVTLSFGGVAEKLTIPFAALIAFADPSVKFELRFQKLEPFEIEHHTFEDKKEALAEISDSSEAVQEDENKIISLDAFRKK